MQREDIGLGDSARIDPLLALDRGQSGNAVAQPRRALEFELFGGSIHFFGQTLAHRAGFSGQKIAGLARQLGVIFRRDFAGAGAGAALDLVQQAGPAAVVVKGIFAGAQEEGALQHVESAVDRPHIGERPEIIAFPAARAAMLGQLRAALVPGQQNIGKTLVVAHQHVEARLELLDQIGFEQQGLDLGAGRDEDHRRGQGDHPRDAIGVAGQAGIGGDALPDAFGLADIKHRAVLADHAIDARPHRRMFPMRADRPQAPLERGGGGFGLKIEIDAGAFLGLGGKGFFGLVRLENQFRRRIPLVFHTTHGANLGAVAAPRNGRREEKSAIASPMNFCNGPDVAGPLSTPRARSSARGGQTVAAKTGHLQKPSSTQIARVAQGLSFKLAMTTSFPRRR